MSEWISVTERLPKNLSAVLVWFTGLYHEPKIAFFGGQDFYENINSDDNITKWITHWMYLPDSPLTKSPKMIANCTQNTDRECREDDCCMNKKEFDSDLIERMVLEINDRVKVILNLMGNSETSNKIAKHLAAAAIHMTFFMKDIYEHNSGNSLGNMSVSLKSFLAECGCDFENIKEKI